MSAYRHQPTTSPRRARAIGGTRTPVLVGVAIMPLLIALLVYSDARRLHLVRSLVEVPESPEARARLLRVVTVFLADPAAVEGAGPSNEEDG